MPASLLIPVGFALGVWLLGRLRRSPPAALPEASQAVRELPEGDAPRVPFCHAGKVCSGGFTVSGQSFPAWFNATIKGKPGFPNAIPEDRFRVVFDHVADLWAESITIPEFVAFFCIFYNETGGSLKPVAEYGGPKYCFETKLPNGGSKQSYNKAPNRLAGNQLSARGVPCDVAAWNGTTWPGGPPEAVAASRECDFYKYRGRGLIQTTWRPTYLEQVDPLLRALGLKSCDDMSTDELDRAVLENPSVYLGMVKAFFRAMAEDFAKVNQEPPLWAPTGARVSGSKAYGSGLFTSRCQTLFDAMRAGGLGAADGSSATVKPSGPATLAPALVALLEQLNELYPKRSKASDGALSTSTGDTDGDPSGKDAHALGNALDITRDDANGPDLHQLRDVLLSDPRTLEVVYDHRIGARQVQAGALMATEDFSPPLNPHERQLHVSIDPSQRNDGRRWPQSELAPNATKPAPVLQAPPAKAAGKEAAKPVEASTDEAGGLTLERVKAAMAGGLVAAWNSHNVDNIHWTTIAVGPYLVDITSDALSVRGVRIPASFADILAICGTTPDLIPLSRPVVDAAYAQAAVKLDATKVRPTSDPAGERANNPDQVLAHARQMPPVSDDGRLVAGGMKDWIGDGTPGPTPPGTGAGSAVNYGYQADTTPGHVVQTPGHHHEDTYKGYSQGARLMRRRATLAATGAPVDLVELLAKGDPAIGGPFPSWLIERLQDFGGPNA